MDKQISNIYRVANRCGFEVKHREDNEKVVFAFKSKEIELNCFFEVVVQKAYNSKIFAANVAHEVFLIAEDFDPHTETRKYLDKIGGSLQQYTEIYSQMAALAWQIRKFWLSL